MHRLKMLNFAMRSPDGVDGGGGAPPATADQPQGQAQGQEANPLLSQVSNLLSEQLGAFKDSMHADIRRQIDGISSKGKATPKPAPANATATPAVEGLTMEAVQRMMTNRDALHAASSGANMSAGARSRMLRAYESESPEDAGAWASEYISDFGLGGESSATTQPATSPATPQGPPVTASATPAPNSAVNENTPLLNLSEADRNALIQQKGIHWFRATLREQMRNVKVKVRNI